MSLKAFHVFFIIVSTVLTIGFGVWAVRSYLNTGEPMSLFMACGSFAGCILLVFYFRWFLRKLKDESYL